MSGGKCLQSRRANRELEAEMALKEGGREREREREEILCYTNTREGEKCNKKNQLE